MTRRELRTHFFRLLYRVFFYSEEELDQQIELYLEDPEVEADVKDSEFIKNRVKEIIRLIPEIDSVIDEKAERWKVNRINYVDLSILRLAYYEIAYDDEVPTAVAINEAVEISKIYGGSESSSFINGVLAKLL